MSLLMPHRARRVAQTYLASGSDQREVMKEARWSDFVRSAPSEFRLTLCPDTMWLGAIYTARIAYTDLLLVFLSR